MLRSNTTSGIEIDRLKAAVEPVNVYRGGAKPRLMERVGCCVDIGL